MVLSARSDNDDAGVAGVMVTVGDARVDGEVTGIAILSFMPAFSKMVVFVTVAVVVDGVDTSSKFSSSDFLLRAAAAAAAAAASMAAVGELMFFSFILLKILTFKRPVLEAVVTENTMWHK